MFRHPKSEIGLTEVLQACKALGVREGIHAQWLAQCLGLTWKEAEVSQSVPAPTPGGPSLPDSSAETPATTKQEPKKLRLLDPVGQEPMAFEQIFEGHAERIRNAEEIRVATKLQAQSRPAFQPLFLNRWFQGIFTAILGVPVLSREIDFRKLERAVIEGEVFSHLPFKHRAKLVKGVHVLLDRSESMQPFWSDQSELLSRLRRLLGHALVQNTWFKYDAQRSRLIWRTPMPRQFRMDTPVLIVTDFGGEMNLLGAQSIDWEPWLPIFQLAQSSRSRVVALIPSSPDFWPEAINSFVDGSLLWDRETSPLTAAKLCRR